MTFTLPICYTKGAKQLSKNVVDDLELIDSKSDESSIYETIFTPKDASTKQIVQQMAQYITTDINFLKQTQQLIGDCKDMGMLGDPNTDEMMTLLNEMRGDTGFCQKYLYVDWNFAKCLNQNASFLHIMSLYNIASPLLSIFLPILALIVPFIILYFQKGKCIASEYIDLLKKCIGNHSIFKMFTQFHEMDTSNRIYISLSSAFYVFSIYQNILTCVRFYSNLQKIHTHFQKWKHYVEDTLVRMKYFIEKIESNKCDAYNMFHCKLIEYSNKMETFLKRFQSMSLPFSFSFSKIKELGEIMKLFYELHEDDLLYETLTYSFGFNGYYQLFCNILPMVNENKLTKTTIRMKPCVAKWKQMVYPKFIHSDSIKNNCKLNKNMIITGPNASGKTTTLKTSLLNIILSQQIGFGCFESFQMHPFSHIHSYLNIPDTSGRDSLFQAEARRCKEIIDLVDSNPSETHFCIFDELFSGTNPEEATQSAVAFVNYLCGRKNVSFMLTTHYLNICYLMKDNERIINYQMSVDKINKEEIKFTYSLKKGISKIKGGIQVLRDMNYPKEILHHCT
jgi:hypothetical protein